MMFVVSDADDSPQVYSAPSGKFHAHVDTPRGPQQFGSLVVCLPYAHEGGTLRVKHRGQTTDFAWGERNSQSVNWAAFFGDCEHEVLEVTKGHRVTLTYNLYRTSTANPARQVADPEHLPLYGKVKTLLENRAFLPGGERINFNKVTVQLPIPFLPRPINPIDVTWLN